jgi:hypothetical protein
MLDKLEHYKPGNEELIQDIKLIHLNVKKYGVTLKDADISREDILIIKKPLVAILESFDIQLLKTGIFVDLYKKKHSYLKVKITINPVKWKKVDQELVDSIFDAVDKATNGLVKVEYFDSKFQFFNLWFTDPKNLKG